MNEDFDIPDLPEGTQPDGDSDADDAAAQSLGLSLRDKFDKAEKARHEVEQRWLSDLRQYKGQYEPEVERRIHPNRSRAYLQLTRVKIETLTRMMMAGLLGNKETNWAIDPTPDADLGQEDKDMLAQQFVQNGIQPSPDMVEAAEQDLAKQRAENMANEIEDQLAENRGRRYADVLRAAIKSGNLFGTGVIKGPLVVQEPVKRWKLGPDGKTWSLAQEYDTQQQPLPDGSVAVTSTPKVALIPYIEFVPVWDLYPDMSATCLDDAQYIFQRKIMIKTDLLELAKREDFKGDAIKDYIKEHPEGDADTYKSFENELNSLSQDKDNQPKRERKYELLEFWGLVSGSELQGVGLEIPEEDLIKDFWANVFLLDTTVIKADLNPLEGSTLPYFFYYNDKDETSIFGEGIATRTRQLQDMINAAVRMVVDNAAMSSGPQFEINRGLIRSGEDLTDIRPWRVWLRDGDPEAADKPAVRVIEIPSCIEDAMKVLQISEAYIDEVSNVPKQDTGDPQGNQTATEASILATRSNTGVSEQIKKFDDTVTVPLITALYNWNMQFNPDPNIKGDMKIVVKGTAAAQVKESRAQILATFRQQVGQDPALSIMVDWPKFLKEFAQNADVPEDVILGDDEIQQKQQELQGQQAQAQAQMAMQEFAKQTQGSDPRLILAQLAQMAGLLVNPQAMQQGQQPSQPGLPPGGPPQQGQPAGPPQGDPMAQMQPPMMPGGQQMPPQMRQNLG